MFFVGLVVSIATLPVWGFMASMMMISTMTSGKTLIDSADIDDGVLRVAIRPQSIGNPKRLLLIDRPSGLGSMDYVTGNYNVSTKMLQLPTGTLTPYNVYELGDPHHGYFKEYSADQIGPSGTYTEVGVEYIMYFYQSATIDPAALGSGKRLAIAMEISPGGYILCPVSK